MQTEIEITREGWDSLQAGNGAIVGSVLTFVFFVKRYLNKHLDDRTKRSMGQFEEAVKGHLHQMLDRLEGSMKTPDARNAITELGPLPELEKIIPSCVIECSRIPPQCVIIGPALFLGSVSNQTTFDKAFRP